MSCGGGIDAHYYAGRDDVSCLTQGAHMAVVNAAASTGDFFCDIGVTRTERTRPLSMTISVALFWESFATKWCQLGCRSIVYYCRRNHYQINLLGTLPGNVPIKNSRNWAARSMYKRALGSWETAEPTEKASDLYALLGPLKGPPQPEKCVCKTLLFL